MSAKSVEVQVYAATAFRSHSARTVKATRYAPIIESGHDAKNVEVPVYAATA
jgi:hypothetical protein